MVFNKIKIKAPWVVYLFLCIASSCYADDDAGERYTEKYCIGNSLLPRCMTGDQPSYFGIVPNSTSNYDNSHAEFMVSIKEPLWGRYLKGNESNPGIKKGVYFGYTGKYDFYVNTRYSSPIVSRLQNVGLFYKYEKDLDFDVPGFKSYTLGWRHESNGQDVDSQAVYDARLSEINLALNGDASITTPDSRRIASDYLSRGWDYFYVIGKYTYTGDVPILRSESITNIYFSTRFYLDCQALCRIKGREEYYSWLPEIDKKKEAIYRYKTFDLVISRRLRTPKTEEVDSGFFDKALRVWDNTRQSLSMTFGDRLGNFSLLYQITYQPPGWVPFTLRYFNGYGENISDFQRRSTYVLFGIEIW